MPLEQGLYEQAVMKRRRESDDIKEKYKKKYNFQGQLSRTKHWFNLDHEWPKGILRHVNQISMKTI